MGIFSIENLQAEQVFQFHVVLPGIALKRHITAVITKHDKQAETHTAQ